MKFCSNVWCIFVKISSVLLNNDSDKAFVLLTNSKKKKNHEITLIDSNRQCLQYYKEKSLHTLPHDIKLDIFSKSCRKVKKQNT